MKKKLKNIAICTALAISVLSFAGCGNSNNSSKGENATTEAPKPVLTLSIGTKDDLKNYDYIYETATPGSTALTWDASNPDADTLIAILAEVTGWNLNLAEPVSVTPGSFIICFAEDSSIYTGAVDSSKADFAITDRQKLVNTILDSIVANMNTAYKETLTIYFASADGSDITIPDAGITISASEPYATVEEEE